MYIPITVVMSVAALIMLILVTSVFLIAQLKQDNSIMDIVYGPLFILSGGLSAWLLQSHTTLSLIILALLTLWGTRLGIRIYRKNRGQNEDARYAAWRTAWSERGSLYFILRSYIQINLLQGIVIVVVSLPLIISLSQPSATFSTFPLLAFTVPFGAVVFGIGLLLESLSDWQLDRFIARKKAGTETATLMTTGLFRYSRRPNYFGETLIWWGLALMVLPLPYGYLALLSPLTITYIVTQVTGPMLEKLFLERYPEEYRAYQKRTSYFIPLPPREDVSNP
jgi:steroid 5-alpha reductase family enzyme